MRIFDFDPSIGLIVGSNKQLTILTDLDALKCKVEQRLRFFLGEWFLNTSDGIPYFQQIFEKPVNDGLIISLINNDLIQETDITSIDDVSIDFDRMNRNFTYTATIVSTYGTTSVSSGITV